FSSRRRHTRSKRDWSSDVCSSDLPASHEPMDDQFTRNLFYTEAIHNQSFWMPPFIEAAEKLQADQDARHDEKGLVLTNTRIVHRSEERRVGKECRARRLAGD